MVQTYDPVANEWVPFNSQPLFSSSGAAATLTSLGNNIASDATGNLTASGDRPETQPGLFVSGTDIESGAMGYTVGVPFVNWPNVNSDAVQFHINFNPSDNFDVAAIARGILKLKSDVSLTP